MLSLESQVLDVSSVVLECWVSEADAVPVLALASVLLVWNLKVLARGQALEVAAGSRVQSWMKNQMI